MRFKICPHVRCDTTIPAKNMEMGEAVDLEQAQDSCVIDGRHSMRPRKVKSKARY